MMLERETYIRRVITTEMPRCDGELIRNTVLLASIFIIILILLLAIIKGLRTDIDCPLTPNCVYINTFNQDYDIYVGDKYICSATIGYIPVNDTSCYLKIEDDDNWCNVSIVCDNFSRKLLKGTLLGIFVCVPTAASLYATVKMSMKWWDWYYYYNRIYEQERENDEDINKELLEAASYE